MEKQAPVAKVKKGDQTIIVNATDVEKYKANGFRVVGDRTPDGSRSSGSSSAGDEGSGKRDDK